MTDLISVIIVNYNSGEYLYRCVRSLYENAGELQIEVVVVDNASCDYSVCRIDTLKEKIDSLHVINNQSNLGFSKAVNQALANCKGDYVFLLNPDCYIFQNTLPSLLKVYEKEDNVGLVGAAVFNEDGTEQRGGRRREPTLLRSLVTLAGLDAKFKGINLLHEKFPENFIEVDAVSGAAMFLKRDFFQSLGGMDENYFLHCEDLDLCHTIRKSGRRVIYANQALVMHKQGVSGNGINLQVEQYKHAGMSYYYQKHYAQNALERNVMFVLIKLRLCVLQWQNKRQKITQVDLNNQGNILAPLNNARKKIIVSGGRSDVGDSMIKLFTSQHNLIDYDLIYVSRRPVNTALVDDNKIRWLNIDFIKKMGANDFIEVAAWINLAPIWTVEDFARVLVRFRPNRLIALSSTSIFTKVHSKDLTEQALVRQLQDGERQAKALSVTMPVFILRPTMIYGGRRNKNVNVIKSIVKYTGFFPMVGQGTALRQPVHCEDVAHACLQLVGHCAEKKLYDYNLPGNEKLSYRQLVERVFTSLNRRPRFISLPLIFARLLLKLLGWLPGMSMISTQAANRMQQDLSFSYDKAQTDFNYQPRNFNP